MSSNIGYLYDLTLKFYYIRARQWYDLTMDIQISNGLCVVYNSCKLTNKFDF